MGGGGLARDTEGEVENRGTGEEKVNAVQMQNWRAGERESETKREAGLWGDL